MCTREELSQFAQHKCARLHPPHHQGTPLRRFILIEGCDFSFFLIRLPRKLERSTSSVFGYCVSVFMLVPRD